MKANSKKPGKRQLQRVLAALEEIESHFDMIGMALAYREANVSVTPEPREMERTAESEQSAANENDFDTGEADEITEDDSYDYYSEEAEGYDREDIEIAIDAFLSELHRARLIKKNKKGKLPSFTNVFEDLFGDSTVSRLAKDFEDFVEGYFGFISYEAMLSAREQFVEIRSILRSELANAQKS